MPTAEERYKADVLTAIEDGEKGSFEFYKNSDGWRWRYRKNGKTIASGQGYENFEDCERAIEIMRHSSGSPALEVSPPSDE